MRKFVQNHRKLVAVTAIIVLLVGWFAGASIRGGIVACFDIARGHYEVLGYGLPPLWTNEYHDLLQKRYGVRFHPVAGCLISPSLASYVDGYNAVAKRAINHKFGHDIFRECANEARIHWEQTTLHTTNDGVIIFPVLSH